MSYKENLGRVKGETGTSYVPYVKEVTKNGITYSKIVWRASNESNPPNQVEGDLFPLAYIPTIDQDTGALRFTLSQPTDYTFTLPKSAFQGEKGNDGHLTIHTIATENDLPTSNIDADALYFDSYGNCYIWDDDNQPNKWVTVEDAIKFNNYYTKNETYARYNASNKTTTSYSAKAIDDKIGDTTTAIQQINNILNNGSINIPMDNG